MKKATAVMAAIASIGAAGIVPATASAAPITECGSMTYLGWTAQNITTRNVSCSDARSFARKISDLPHWYTDAVTFPGWHTYSVHYQPYRGAHGWWMVDMRATRPNHVIRFQYGPYGVSDGGGGYPNGKCAGIPIGQPCY